ncbi:MAG: response regulator transcription factor [Lachnospiraceae bacterium]|nr:response regulator transcription factor [Lachnospiraceae bacterium]
MKILLIEDDFLLCQSLQFHFEKKGIALTACNDGLSGYTTAVNNSFDLIILDRMLPDMDGLAILKNLRNRQISTPVIFLTALDSLEDKVTGLNCGADDYMVKPFEFDELLARIRTLLRRIQPKSTQDFTFDRLSYDYINHQLSWDSQTVLLSKREAEVFEALISNLGNTVSRDQLISKVWGIDSDIENGNLDNYIYFLRKHLAMINSEMSIQTVHGVGFKLCKKE